MNFGTLSRPLPKKQISRLLLVDAAVIIVLLAMPVRMGWKGYQTSRDQLHAQEERRDHFMAQVGLAERAERQQPVLLGEIRADIDLLTETTRRLRPPVQSPAIMEEIRDFARQSGLERVSVQPRPMQTFEGFYRQPLFLTGYGSYSEILRVIHALRNRDTFLITETLTIRIEEADERNPVLRMELILHTLLAEELMPMSEITRVLADTTGTLIAPGTSPGEPGGPGEGRGGDR
jgi:Tfp pilus assembly protein PilO